MPSFHAYVTGNGFILTARDDYLTVLQVFWSLECTKPEWREDVLLEDNWGNVTFEAHENKVVVCYGRGLVQMFQFFPEVKLLWSRTPKEEKDGFDDLKLQHLNERLVVCHIEGNCEFGVREAEAILN